MESSIHKSLSDACMVLLRPLVKIMLRNGIAYGAFAELVKKAYVDIAYEEFSEPGKKQTISRISALTGIFRREAKRLLEEPSTDTTASQEKYNRAIRVISGWVNDPNYVDNQGQPRILSMYEGPYSFSQLVKSYSGDIPIKAMLTILEKSKTIKFTQDNFIKLIKRAYIPSNDPIEKIHILGNDVAELIATIDHNLTATQGHTFFQRKVSNNAIDVTSIDAFKSLSSKKAQALLEELNAWLSQHETHTEDAPKRYVSIGIYYSESHSQETPS